MVSRAVQPCVTDQPHRLVLHFNSLVHPSRLDALPSALIHGLAAGVSAVVSAVGGITEMVTPSTGVLVAPEDPVALAAGGRDARCRDTVSSLIDAAQGCAVSDEPDDGEHPQAGG